MRLRRNAPADLTGHRVLITGAAGGIGYAAAQSLIARGAKVAVLDLDEDDERSSATAAIREYVSHSPSWAAKTLPPSQAGEAMAHAIATRATRVAEQRYVHAALLLRDLVARSDAPLARHAGIQTSVRVAEAEPNRVPAGR